MRRRPLLLAALPATAALTLPAADAPASEVIEPRNLSATEAKPA